MGVCNNCGNQISDGQLTCPVCGAYTGAGAQANNQTPQQNMYNQQGMYNQASQQNMYNQQGMYNQAPQQNMYNQQDMLDCGMDSSFLQAEFMVRTLIGYIVIFLA